MKDLGEVILKSKVYEDEVLGNEKTIEISHKKYILGFEVEHAWAKKTVSELIKGLTKEEWDWVIMDPQVPCIVKDFWRWYPEEDPRPDWKIQRIQDQNQTTNNQPIQNSEIATMPTTVSGSKTLPVR